MDREQACVLAPWVANIRSVRHIDGMMSPAELADILDLLEWSNRHLAKRLSYSEGQVRRWRNELQPVPDEVAAWLRECADIRRAHPFKYPPAPERDL
jgi:hypothetical protein